MIVIRVAVARAITKLFKTLADAIDQKLFAWSLFASTLYLDSLLRAEGAIRNLSSVYGNGTRKFKGE
jgi:hypothetical protein